MADDPTPIEQDPITRERNQRIAELELRAQRPLRVGVLPPVSALALAGALSVLWTMRGDVAYFLAPRQAIELGVEGDYRFAEAASNRYAQLHGAPTVRGAYFEDRGRAWVAIGVTSTPLVVVRPTLPSETFQPGVRGSRPDQRPFHIGGRLLSREDASARYESALSQLDSFGEVKAAWVLVAEAYPGKDLRTMATIAVLGTFALVNAWFLLRGIVFAVQVLRQRLQAPKREEGAP